MSILSVSDISKSYKEKLAVENLSFELDEGDFWFLGPNGEVNLLQFLY